MVTLADVEQALRSGLGASDVTVVDISGGCGQSFEVSVVVTPQFQGKRLLERHKLVNAALKEHMPSIHALSIKKCWTPEEQAAAGAAAGAAQ